MQLNRVLLSAIAMLAFLFLLGHALAQEKKLKKSDLPPARSENCGRTEQRRYC